MKKPGLRQYRSFAALIFFIFAFAAFIVTDETISPLLADIFKYSQIIPLVITVSTGFTLFSLIAILLILLMTIIFGRVYCSVLCPFGILQDILGRIRKKKIKYRARRVKIIIPTLLVALLIFSVLIKENIALVFLDPFSNFGRIISGVFLTLISNSVNLTAGSGIMNRLIIVEPMTGRELSFMFIYGTVTLGFLYYFVGKNGRLFCNYLCPAGAALAFVSKFSKFRVSIDQHSCIGCGACEKFCKSGCIDTKQKQIDNSQCVLCFNCIDICPSESIKYSTSITTKNIPAPDESRRNFLFSAALFGINLSPEQFRLAGIDTLRSKIPVYREFAVCPPGSVSYDNFLEKCTACQLCVSACPTGVLDASFSDYGFQNIFKPRLDFAKSYCNFDCVLCSEICPTGAIMPIRDEVKKLTRLGKAVLIEKNCVVFTDKKDCGACAEHCPTKAVRMVDKDGLRVPALDNRYCIGCGACEHACPTKPYKSIYVDGLIRHESAEKLKEEKIRHIQTDDFPF
ncbi:MAG: 4Fe-4S dicluster domain-containing protein [Ignavibacteriales bacterium]|nr:4Fe-4S dicluster domain-containing protein [Ignavibacteriales bacterium]MCF8307215.1 4Fe-4S dicluster domain-containing protein [Ignavibacteriales bacterium]MCF8315220.1 4Fe-4S dicluster domain-containing protein [Ignavibacteriales bacterium]MCF8438495.1 4Fe-4S dicluster domain-containing protein [Ignavibacteriales bacterium]